MVALSNYPGWKQWVHKRVEHTLYYDDAHTAASRSQIADVFLFTPDLERQHALVYQYLGLQQTIETLKECEYYFRRYPFRGLPITRASHITNICEMYFGRFYELKERLRKYFEALKAIAPDHNLNIGKFIREYERLFDEELRARHGVHHHGRFQDVAIDRVYLVETTFRPSKRVETAMSRRRYRKVTDEWVRRVRRRGKDLDQVLEAVADATLRTCRFITLYALAATIHECRGLPLNARRRRK